MVVKQIVFLFGNLIMEPHKVYVAERFQPVNFQLWKLYEHAAITCEPFKVGVALLIQAGPHPLDLKIGHIIYPSAEGAFVTARTVELETLNQTTLWQRLIRHTHYFAKTNISGKNTNNVSAAGNPDKSLVFLSL